MSGVGAASKLSLPGPLKSIGRRHLQLLSHWIGSATVFGVTSGVTLCYFTDWRVVVDYLPYYNGKFKQDEE